MATATLTLTGTQTGEWDTTPGVGATEHHTLIDETYPPGDQADFTQVNGHVAGKIDAYYLSAGPAGMSLITNLHLTIFAEGTVITHIPAFRVEVYVSDAIVAQRAFSFDSNGGFAEGGVNIPLNVLAPDWQNSTRYVKFIPINGAGYGPLPTE